MSVVKMKPRVLEWKGGDIRVAYFFESDRFVINTHAITTSSSRDPKELAEKIEELGFKVNSVEQIFKELEAVEKA